MTRALPSAPLAMYGPAAEAYVDRVAALTSQAALLVDAVKADDEWPPYRVIDGEAIIDVDGVLVARGGWLSLFFGDVPYPMIEAAVALADDDPSVERIVLVIDSPGGDVAGVEQAAAAIEGATKPTLARCDGGMIASGAYWLAAACDRIEVVPTALVGSVGVVQWARVPGDDLRQFVSSSTPRKCASPDTPTGMEDRQRLVDGLATQFLDFIARRRGYESQQVAAEALGSGRLLLAAEALAAGAIDAVVSPGRAAPTSPAQEVGIMPDPKKAPGGEEHAEALADALLRARTAQQTITAIAVAIGLTDAATAESVIKAVADMRAELAEAKKASAKAAEDAFIASCTGLAPAQYAEAREAYRLSQQHPDNPAVQRMLAAYKSPADGVPFGPRKTHSGGAPAGVDREAQAAMVDAVAAEAKEKGVDFVDYVAALRRNKDPRVNVMEGRP